MEPDLRAHRIPWAGALAWSLSALAIAMAIGGIILAARQPAAFVGDAPLVHFAAMVLLILALPYGIVGGLVASRRPRNPLGWLFLAVGCLQAANVFGGAYAYHGVLWHPGSLPGATIAQWVWSWTWFPALALIATLSLLLFPDGRPPSPRWRWVLRVQVVALAALVPAWMASAWPVRGEVIKDEAGLRLAEFSETSPFEVVVMAAMAVTGVIAVLSVLSLLVRFWRATGIQRQQLKWFGAAGGLAVFGLLSVFFGNAAVGWIAPGRVVPAWLEVSLVGLVITLPIAAGIAILRYRLFEIDRIVRRTVAYAAVTVVLVAAYASLVIVLQPLMGSFTSGSDLTVAASTLVVAALVGPLHRRIRRVVDRRFDRARYDAARTVEDFAQRLRDNVDVDTLIAELADVAGGTVRPREVTVWISPGGSSR